MNIGIIGAFAYKTMDTGGQPVKTRQLRDTLEAFYSEDSIDIVDTYGWSKHLLRFSVNLFSLILKSDLLIMLPANRGVVVLAKILYLAKKVLHKKIYYDVIGGWIIPLMKQNPVLEKELRFFDGIFVETKVMYKGFNKLKFSNVWTLPNYKKLEKLVPEELPKFEQEPLPVCTFSRVVREKGIEDAVKAVSRINHEFGKTVFFLDIYGAVDPQFQECFSQLCMDSPDFIRYRGIADPYESVKILKDYFLLLFPTHSYTEGIPGTIIDAYAAGVPVISAKWESCLDIIIPNKTGYVYDFDNKEGLYSMLKYSINNRELVDLMRKNCLEAYEQYSEESFCIKLSEIFNEQDLKSV